MAFTKISFSMGRRVGVVGKSSPTGARRDLWLGAGVGRAFEPASKWEESAGSGWEWTDATPTLPLSSGRHLV